MLKNILVLDDGTEIAAGTAGANAIRALTVTETVSSTDDLCPGGACANKLEITIWVEPGSALAITSGTRLRHYRADAAGTRTLCGTYWAVKPTRQSRNTYKIYAYDAVSKLDGIQGDFPMTLWAFAQAVAQRCGLTITNTELPRSGDYQVQAFYADNLTGRQLLAWVAEASGTFLRATPDGALEFAWYTGFAGYTIGPGSDAVGVPTALGLLGPVLGTVDGLVWTFRRAQNGYFQGGLSYEDYETAPLDKVQIKQSDDDVGVIYPPDETGTNALVIQGNLLLTTASADALRPVAQALYEQLHSVTYTPLEVSLPLTAGAPAPGQIITVTDAWGRSLQAYVMQRTVTGQRMTLTCTGNARRDGTAAVNSQTYQNLQGKMLELQLGVDGLKVTASELQGDYAQMSVTVDGIQAEVSGKIGQAEAKTLIDQRLDTLTLSAESNGSPKDIKGDAQWTDISGNATVTNGVLTLVGTTQESIASLYVPADNLPGLGGRKITYTFEYKVNETVSGEACDVILWYDYQNEADGGYYVLRITTGPGDTAQPTDWTPVSWTIETKRDTINKLQLAASIKKGAQGSVSIRNVSITTEAESNSSTLILKAGSAELSSTKITFSGMVTFEDLSASGTTVINGDNIKTGTINADLIKSGTINADLIKSGTISANLIRSGTIQGSSGNSMWNLDSGDIISGVSGSTRVEINFNGIRWYSSNYLTGVLYSEYGKTYLGSNSRYTFLGWFSSGYPSINANKQSYDDNFGGLYYDHGDRLIHCVASKFEIPGRIECLSLAVNGREI